MLRHITLIILTGISTLTWGQEEKHSDLWYFQLHGPVRSAVIEGLHRTEVQFDRQGRITQMRQDGKPVTVHRDATGRIDSTTTSHGRVDDNHNTKYRERAIDERGNWIARKTQQLPYLIVTERCTVTYYQ